MESHFIEVLFPELIAFLLFTFRMITAIYFYDKSLFARHKIHDVITNNMLSEELDAQLFSIKVLPQHLFCKRRILPVLLSISFQNRISVG